MVTFYPDVSRWACVIAHAALISPMSLNARRGTACASACPAVIDAELRPCLVHFDPAAVDHAVSNLIDNAVKCCPPAAAVRVVVENGRVSVSDHGPGMTRRRALGNSDLICLLTQRDWSST